MLYRSEGPLCATHTRLANSNVDTQRRRIISEFEQLHQFLNEEQKVLLMKLDQEEEKIQEIHNKNLRRLSEKSSSINNLIEEIEGKLSSRDVELLTDIGDTLRRCDTDFQITTCVAPGLKINDFSIPMQYFIWSKMLSIKPAPFPLTLDPNTANAHLVISADRTAVWWEDKKQNVLHHPARFDNGCAVLTSQGFSSGRHYWEVEVGEKDYWEVGAVTDSVERKSVVPRTMVNGYWTIGRFGELYHWAGDDQDCTSRLSLIEKPLMVGVYLDYEGGRLSFYNANNMAHLYTYSLTFKEKVFPFFFTWDQIKIVSSVLLQ
ncbi:E3 ubiquitin-protein ligase TRIM39-like [Protopterus annectens]|uniref:E3 ubiquitin-protein ligase TRIM39-like n=1 Tax=Protopterus annectens TaxID=7888 RepID=UPI001CFBB175|nr:E3 ubiquitin-protein ligase TRIM39-like [Protopterus annectens]